MARKKKGRFRKGDPLADTRSMHFGYDCYLSGPVDGPGRVRCVLRGHKVPAYIVDPLRTQLPQELFWPERNASDAHTMIDAIYDLDCKMLVKWMRMYPEHHFGYENFLIWAERRIVVSGKKAKLETTKLPVSEKILDRTTITTSSWEGLLIDFNVVRMDDGDAWGELILRDDQTTLTRAWVDLQTNAPTITHHYPGRYKARQFYLPRLKQIFGGKAPGKRLIRPQGTQKKILSKNPVR